MKTIPFESSAVKTAVKGAILGSTLALPLMVAAFPASAADQSQDLGQLKAQLQELQSKVANLQDQQKAQAKQESSGDSGSFGGMSLGDTKVQVGGYVRLNAIYHVNEDLGLSGSPDAISPDLNRGEASNGHVHLNARQSRVWIKSSTPTSVGDVHGYVEGDFYGAGGNTFESNSYGFRLRQAYLTWNNWLFGQSWTTFSDFHYGTTLDFWGPEGQIFARQAQIRYTFNLSDTSTLDLAVESPSSNDSFNPPASQPHDKAPDLVARYQFNSGPASLEVAAVGRYLSFDNTTLHDKSTYGWGADIGGSYELPTGTTLMATFTGGKGIGRYLYAPGFYGGAYEDNNADISSFKAWGGTATVSQKLTDTLTTNLVYGFGKNQSTADIPGATGATGLLAQDVHVNLIYQPVDSLMFGVEYYYTYLEQQSGAQGDANTIQLAAQYNF